ncbi:MAG TPA: carboxypeptidase regulatory-like domain-containing protein, partial [Candidatus Kapabacteria bacterium]|nr:carboxypeptidase regulatory-like domain-containing protein [Candidatus Kapabacteria bacterium]
MRKLLFSAGFLVMCFFCCNTGYSQSPGWSSTLTVNPAPSPYYHDWERDPSVVMLILNYSGRTLQNFRFYVQITRADQSELLSTQSDMMTMPPGPTVQTYNSTSVIQWNNAKFDPSMRDQIIRTGILPEGTYTLCVTVQSPSGMELTKACSQFTISLPAQPPQLVSPANDDTVTISIPTFTWTPVISKSRMEGVQYHLVIKEFLPHQDRVHAMQANVVVYDGTNPMTSLVYPSSATPLVDGKEYIWQVQAVNSEGAPAAANNGYSEVWRFVYHYSGMKYKITNVNKENTTSNLTIFNMMATVQGTLLYEFADPGEYLGKPLANTSISLVEKYYIKTSQGIQFLSGYQFPNADKVLATTTTDASGGFTFSYFTTDTMGLLKANTTVTTGGGEFVNTYVGDLYRVARVIVGDPATSYYCSPDNDIIVQPYGIVQAGNLFAYVRSYNLQVTVLPLQGLDQATNGPLAGMFVYLLRQNRPSGVPADEGQNLNQTKSVLGTNYTVISKATTDQNGIASFKRAVKNIGPNDAYYIYAESDPTGQLSYFSLLASSFQFNYNLFFGQNPNYTITNGEQYGADNATYDSQYGYPTVGTNFTMLPLEPSISGNVYRSDNKDMPVSFAPIILNIVPLIFPVPLVISVALTNNNGHFDFEELKSNYDSNHQLNSAYTLAISEYGFRDTTITNLGPLKWGIKDYIDRIYLQPAAQVHGTVVDDDGNPANAHITIGSGATMYASSSYTYKKRGKYFFPIPGPAKFEGPAILGTQMVVIDPDDKSDYFAPDTTFVNITSVDQDLGELHVYKKEHRIKIQANQYIVKGNTASSGPPVQGAHVTIQNTNPPLTAVTDANGNATFTFTNASNNFNIEITAPDGQDYVGQVISASVPETKDWTLEYVYMQPATHIFGKVYAGQSPVAGAHVFLDESSSSPIETYTDQNGNYILHNIPYGIYKFKAAKSKSNYIGDSITVDLSQSSSPGLSQGTGKFRIHVNMQNTHKITDSTNFYLKIYGDMDITKLLGFPIEVATLDSTSQGVKISGSFIKLPGNTIFSVDSSLHLEFKDVFIVPGGNKNSQGIPLAEPKTLPVVTDQNTLNMYVYGKMLGVQKDSVNGISVDSAGNEAGEISAGVSISASSFSSSSIKFEGGGFSLVRPDVSGNVLNIPTIVANGINPISAPNGFRVASASGGTLHYQIYGFDADADSSQSFINGDTVRLATTLHTNLNFVTPPDIDLNIGDVLLHTTSLDPVAGQDSISIPLEQWSLVSKKWGLSTSGFVMDGVVRTGTVDVPFTGMQLSPTALQYGTFSFGSLNLAGVVPLAVTGKATFGYDNGIG